MFQPKKYLEYLYQDLGSFYFKTPRNNQLYLDIQNSVIQAFNAKLMRTKNQAFDTFQKFICYAKQQLKKKLKYLRTNFEGEFTNQAFEEYTAKEGIKEEPSASYMPEQNGKAKYLNYILISLVHLILSTMHLPKTLWDELIKIITYLKN